MTSARKDERGYALVAVLWASILLSVIAAALVSQSRFAARIESNEWRRLEIETFAEAATNHAIHALLNAGEVSPVLLSGAPLKAEWRGEPFQFSFEDETGKIDLNEVDAPVLANAFRSAGVSAEAADALSLAVIDWRTPSKSRAVPAAPSAFRRFQSVSELMLVPAIDSELFQRVKRTLTVYAQSSVPNPELANEATLNALFLNDQAKIDVLLVQSRLAAEIAVRGFSNPATETSTALKGKAIAVRVAFRIAGRDCDYNTVIRITGVPQRPIWILNQERLR